MTEEQNRFIIRDSDQTKFYLYEAKEGYMTHFSNYVMYKKLFGTVPIEITAGLHKYTTLLYYELKHKYKEFDKLKDEDYKRIGLILEKDEPTIEDYKFITNFIIDFWNYSGLSNIIFQIDDPGQSIKKNR